MNGSEMRSESPYTMLKRRHHQTRLEGIRWARYLVMGRGSRQEQPRIHCNLIPPRNGETTCVSRWLPSITAENQWDHACNLLPDPQREGNTLWFMINSKLAGGACLEVCWLNLHIFWDFQLSFCYWFLIYFHCVLRADIVFFLFLYIC